MDPDMNKYDLNHRVAHHPKMSDAEWEDAYRAAWEAFYAPEHIRTILQRAAACRLGRPKTTLTTLLWFKLVSAYEGVHPLEGGAFRRKFRRHRRNGLPRENPFLFTYYFSLLGVLCWLRPTARQIERAVLAMGVATFVLMAILWVVVPASWYTVDATNSKFFIFEFERGNRIYMPMFFGYLLMFYLARRLSSRMRITTGAVIATGFALLLWINKQRTSIGGAALVVAVSACPARWRVLAFLGGAIALGVATAFTLAGPASGVVDSFGSSLSVRQQSLIAAIEYLGDDPLRWLFGVGATTRFSSVTLADIFKSEQFYLADIGWVGIVFEFGIIGASLVAAVYATGLVVTTRAGAGGDPFLQSLSSYVLFMIVTSAIYSVVFTPGELATVVAMSEYLARYAPRVPGPRAVSGFVALSAHGTR
jgi:hypothetical protein